MDSPPTYGRVHLPTFADREDCSRLPEVLLPLQNLFASLCASRCPRHARFARLWVNTTATCRVLCRKSLPWTRESPLHGSTAFQLRWLEFQLQGKLYLTLRYHGRRDHAGLAGTIGDEWFRLRKDGVIQGIEEFCPEPRSSRGELSNRYYLYRIISFVQQ
jgi:hypothetical protein